jgi:hypothetical protein
LQFKKASYGFLKSEAGGRKSEVRIEKEKALKVLSSGLDILIYILCNYKPI